MDDTQAKGSGRANERQPESAWAISLGRVAGIPIRLHITFLLLLGWLAFTGVGGSGAERWYAVLYVCAIFACVVLHELGHSVVAQRRGIRVSEIVLYPIGGLARLTRLPAPRDEFVIALAGPAVNLVIAGVIYGVLLLTGGMAPWSEVSFARNHWWQQLMAANLLLAVFNMLPAFPMDGGRVMRALLAMRLGELRATEIASGVGQVMAFGLGFLGLISGNFILLFIAFFVYIGAGAELAIYRQRALTHGAQAGRAMVREFRTLSVGATLGEAADLLLATSQQDFPVVNGDEVVGVLTRQGLLRGLAQHGATGYVAGSMEREFRTVTLDSDIEDLALDMQSGRQPCVLVMDGSRLAGLITTENLAEFLAVRQLIGRAGQAA
ncbi:MAG: site-2 protease family protein [Chthonomonadales bacterium]|nr:site-2 protease family protein [Chthonomonadales bacterium]